MKHTNRFGQTLNYDMGSVLGINQKVVTEGKDLYSVSKPADLSLLPSECEGILKHLKDFRESKQEAPRTQEEIVERCQQLYQEEFGGLKQ